MSDPLTSGHLEPKAKPAECLLMALRVILHSRLERSLLEEQRTSGDTGTESIGSD